MINKTIEYKISLFFSKIFDIYYIFLSIPYLSYLSGENNIDRSSIFFNFIFFSIITGALKIIIKKERPCVDLDLDYCPPDYDIPSGHSLSGIYFSLLLLEKNGKNIKNYISILPLILQPLFRIILKVHGTEAVIYGSSLGVIAYLFEKQEYIKKLFKIYKISF